MKVRMIVLCAVAAVVVALVVAGCENKGPEESWTYVGTWANSDYNGLGGGPPAKLVMTATSMTYYDNVADPVPIGTGTFAVADDWTRGDNHYFKGIAVIAPDTYFFLMRVSNDNDTLESNSSDASYPAVINPAGSNYGIFARQ
jgi:hypothetical protein